MDKYNEMLYDKFREHKLSEEKLEEGLTLIKEYENKKSYNYKEIYLHLGIAFILSSILYLVAFNWKGMTGLQKISIMTVTTIIPFTMYIFLKKNIHRNLALFSLEFLIGILFALFGQIYQTGADIYMLFTVWSVSILPMVIVGKFLPSYFLLFITSSTAMILYIKMVGSAIGIATLINIIPLLFIILITKVFKDSKLSIKKAEKFFITILFMHYFFIIPPYSFKNQTFFYTSLLYYILWSIGLNLRNMGKYYKILSTIPLFSLIPPTIIFLLKDTIRDEDGILLIMILIVAAYILLIWYLNKIRGDKNEEN